MKYLIVLLFLVGCTIAKTECENPIKILVVGACDKYGECSVMYQDGTYGMQRYPIFGKEVCK